MPPIEACAMSFVEDKEKGSASDDEAEMPT